LHHFGWQVGLRRGLHIGISNVDPPIRLFRGTRGWRLREEGEQ
jgi:hypothetical protein